MTQIPHSLSKGPGFLSSGIGETELREEESQSDVVEGTLEWKWGTGRQILDSAWTQAPSVSMGKFPSLSLRLPHLYKDRAG